MANFKDFKTIFENQPKNNPARRFSGSNVLLQTRRDNSIFTQSKRSIIF